MTFFPSSQQLLSFSAWVVSCFSVNWRKDEMYWWRWILSRDLHKQPGWHHLHSDESSGCLARLLCHPALLSVSYNSMVTPPRLSSVTTPGWSSSRRARMKLRRGSWWLQLGLSLLLHSVLTHLCFSLTVVYIRVISIFDIRYICINAWLNFIRLLS